MTTVDEAARLEAIDSYDVITSPPASELQGLVRLAAMLCEVSKAVINIIDDRFQHQIAAEGFEPAVCARTDSMCVAVLTEQAPSPQHCTIALIGNIKIELALRKNF